MMSVKNLRVFVYFLFGASFCLSISGTYIFGLLVILDLIWRASSGEGPKRWVLSPLDVPLLAYFIWGVVSSVINGSASVLSAIRGQQAIIFFVLFAHAFSEKDWRVVVLGFCAAAGFAGFWGILQISFTRTMEVPSVFKGIPSQILNALSSRMGRAIGTRSHPLTYAESFIPAFFIFLVTVKKSWESKEAKPFFKWGSLIGLVLVVSGLLASQARGVWLGIILGTVLVFIFFMRQMPLKIVVGLILFCAVIFGSAPSLRSRAMSIFTASSGSMGDQISKSARMSLWKESFNEFRMKPIAGVGIDGVQLKIANDFYGKEHIWSETHNVYLQCLLESGIIGFGLFIWILMTAFWLLLKSRDYWGSSIFGSMVTLLLAGLTESWLNDTEIAIIFFILLGAVVFFRRGKVNEAQIRKI